MSAARADDTALVSIVAPVYNEIETLPEFHRRVTAALAGRTYELVLVDDGSSDGTSELLEQLAARDPAVRPVYLSRNFGHQAALTAGLEAARGAATVTIDADLQDPPEVIPRLLEQWARRRGRRPRRPPRAPRRVAAPAVRHPGLLPGVQPPLGAGQTSPATPATSGSSRAPHSTR